MTEYMASNFPGELSSLCSCLAPIEDSTISSQAYAAGEYFFHMGNFCVALIPIDQSEAFVLGTNYQTTTVAARLKYLATKPGILG